MSPIVRHLWRALGLVALVAVAFGGGIVTGVVGRSAPSAQRGVLDEAEQRIEADAAHPVDRADQSDLPAYAAWLNHRDPAVVANAAICLIHQANYLLDQQIAGLERVFVSEGGYSETLAAARLQARKRPVPAGPAQGVFPPCPLCGAAMVLRTARQGKNAGSQFLGCAAYPTCKGTAQL